MTSNDLLASASETPAPRGLAPLVRAEWFFLVSAASVASFALFEDRLFSRLDNPLILTVILLLALRSGALVVAIRRSPRGKPREASRRALRDTAADAHHHLDRGRRNLGGRTAWRPQSDFDARYAPRPHHDHHERHGGGDAADWRLQASRADFQSAGRQRLSQRPRASRNLRPHHAGLHRRRPPARSIRSPSNSSW